MNLVKVKVKAKVQILNLLDGSISVPITVRLPAYPRLEVQVISQQ